MARINFKIQKKDVELCPDQYDFLEMNERVYRAMYKLGKTRVDIAKLFGMDATIPLSMQPEDKVPKATMGSIVKLSNYLGVSVRWILHGDPENEVDIFVLGHKTQDRVGIISSVSGSALVQGNENSTIVVKNISGMDLTEQEREMVYTFRRLSVRDQAAVLSFVFELDNG